ncbi:MAG: hypothetical protein IPF46_06800 [Saprospiraceae bacterium]|nr:hypothetical protein [Candidatus Vicinibacter affinis]
MLCYFVVTVVINMMLRGCHGCNYHNGGGAALSDNDSTWLREDPAQGKDGGIYDPFNPYDPKPTPPGYEDVLLQSKGFYSPIHDNPEIIPGNPSIIANRLNILMENLDKSIFRHSIGACQ